MCSEIRGCALRAEELVHLGADEEDLGGRVQRLVGPEVFGNVQVARGHP